MLTKKICMLGAFAVGKTSLVKQYVYSIFSDDYLTTVGVKISKKIIEMNGVEMNLVLWDMEGRDAFTDVNISYLRGAMGFFLVADGTRRDTLDAALQLRSTALDVTGPIPHCLLINKADLAPDWQVTRDDVDRLRNDEGLTTFATCAKTGQSVEESFRTLAEAML
ncbi:MAG: GTP-binding protein [Desulfovibrio sp.]|nr:GTP-binding protein [Desulfovibrio sp.]